MTEAKLTKSLTRTYCGTVVFTRLLTIPIFSHELFNFINAKFCYGKIFRPCFFSYLKAYSIFTGVMLSIFFCNYSLFVFLFLEFSSIRIVYSVYFNIISKPSFNVILMTAVTFPLCPPRLALAICGRR